MLGEDVEWVGVEVDGFEFVVFYYLGCDGVFDEVVDVGCEEDVVVGLFY